MITKHVAMSLNHRDEVIHVEHVDYKGHPVRARVNGALKTWKRDPRRFRLPMKYGLRECFYIDEFNAAEWMVPDERPYVVKAIREAFEIMAADLPHGTMGRRQCAEFMLDSMPQMFDYWHLPDDMIERFLARPLKERMRTALEAFPYPMSI